MGSVSVIKSGWPTVTYIDSNGNSWDMTGNRPWRNNNPGNLWFPNDEWAYNSGAIGRDSAGFGIYPDYETGRQALEDWWQRHSDRNETIEEAVKKYAPPNENNRQGVKSLLGSLAV
jgi:hypothetical protein